MKIWTRDRSNNVHTQRTRWKALAEIYTMHSFAPFFNLTFSLKIVDFLLIQKAIF